MTTPNVITESIADVVAEAINEQSFYRRYANTINATVAAFAGALGALVTYWVSTGEPNTLLTALAFIVPVITGVATRLTTNGVSDRTLVLLEDTAKAQSKQLAAKEAAAAEREAKLSTLPVYDDLQLKQEVADNDSTEGKPAEV